MSTDLSCRLMFVALLGVLFLPLTRQAAGQQAPMPIPSEPGQVRPGTTPDAEATDQRQPGAKDPAVAPPSPFVPESRQPRPAPADRVPPPTALAYRSPVLRLASVPNMLGDSLQGITQLRYEGNYEGQIDIPLAGGSRRVKIAENNKALPMNRCYFMYHHFHNALEADLNFGVGPRQSYSIDRYTLGLEKTFLDDLWSIDVRMPFTGDYAAGEPGFFAQGGDVGNLAVILKRLIWTTDTCAVAAGVGVETPTGSDASAGLGTASLVIHNEAVNVSPYVGFLSVPNPRWFWHGFLQVDVPTNENSVDISYPDVTGGRTLVSETLPGQTLLYADISGGYWFYRNPSAPTITGLASLVEFHYTANLSDAAPLAGNIAGGAFTLGNITNQIDVTNVTVGLHAETSRLTTVRVAGVFPLETGQGKPFDAEVQLSINRRY